MEPNQMPSAETIAATITGGAIGIPMFWLFLKRVFLIGNTSDANNVVIDLLREEIKRVNEQNIKLSGQIEMLLQARSINDQKILHLELEVKRLQIELDHFCDHCGDGALSK